MDRRPEAQRPEAPTGPSWLSAMLIALALASCGPSTELVTWKDSAFSGPGFRSIFVVVMTEGLAARTAIEGAIAQRLEARGVNAVQSLSLYSPDEKPPYDSVEAQLARLGVDGILIVEPLGKEDIERYTEGGTYYQTYTTYIDARSTRRAQRPEPNTVQVIGTIYHARSSLYANNTDKLVWRGESETPFYGDLQTSARDFATKVVNAMETGGMLRPTPPPRKR